MLDTQLHTPFLQQTIKQCFEGNVESFNAFVKQPLPADWSAYLNQHITTDTISPDQLRNHLCRLRKQIHAWIMVQDLSAAIDCKRTCLELSRIADAFIIWVENYHYELLIQRYGIPRDMHGNAMRMIVLGMGKLGGEELNFSSDIDLIMLYPDEGECLAESGRKTEANAFFLRLGQAVARMLHEPCQNGFVFRVDMRLRPFGKAGAKVCNFGALEWYYQSHARAWERFALGKARAITGIDSHIKNMYNLLNAFVYRRYLDFNILEDLRDTKALIVQQTLSTGNWNVKLGDGGIREIEFFLQSFQLIYGGRNLNIRAKGAGSALRQLIKHDFIEKPVGVQLLKDFYFLRALENRLQYWEEQQTHTLPSSQLEQVWLAHSLGFKNYAALEHSITAIRQRVSALFAMIAKSTTQGADWLSLSAEQQQLQLAHQNPTWLIIFADFCESNAVQQASQRSKKRINNLLNQIVAEATPTKPLADTDALQRCLDVLNAAVKRSTYLALLDENSTAFSALLKATTLSPFLSQELTNSPALMDLFLSPLVFETTPNRASIREEAKAYVRRGSNIEQRLYALQTLKRRQHFKVAYAHLYQRIHVDKVGQSLAWTADIIVREALRIGLTMVDYYRNNDSAEQHLGTLPMLIIGYGKLGSCELGFHSDLDLVIIYDEHAVHEESTFIRTARKFIQILGATTMEGYLYNVDTRLRPEGGSGMLVVSLEQFALYQKNRALLWEKQALLKARPIAGSTTLAKKFHKVRNSVLSATELSHDAMRSQIVAMRQKMHDAHTNTTGVAAIKHKHGGLIDAEFLSQYLTLCHIPQCRKLLRARSVPLQLKILAEAHTAYQKLAEEVTEAYNILQMTLTNLTLQNDKALVDHQSAMQCIAHHYNQVFQDKLKPNA